MRITAIVIENFRCFDFYTIDLASKTTVLIGKNGVGKTALLTAIKKGLSFIFNKDKSISSTFLSASAPTLNIRSFSREDALYNFNELDYKYPVKIRCKSIFYDHYLYWELNRNTAGGKLLSSLYKDASIQFIHCQKKHGVLPILAYFSDSYPHIQTNISQYAKGILKSGKPAPRNFGYYQWDSDTSCAEIWEHRFINSWKQWNNHRTSIELSIEKIKNLNNQFKELDLDNFYNSNPLIIEILNNPLGIKSNISNIEIENFRKHYEIIKKRNEEINVIKNELAFITDCLKDFSYPISNNNSDLELFDIVVTNRDKSDNIEFQFTNGQKILFNLLPTGYKRLFSIVFDIAYRALTLNGNNKENIRGVVIIDEIDLHLHPSLEQEVLERFRLTFPEIQFIVTTHSPLVIANFNQDVDNKILRMKVDGNLFTNEAIPNMYGVDYSTSVSDIMETPARNSTVKQLIDSYIRLRIRDKNESANQIYEELKTLLNNNTTIIDKEIKERLSNL